MDWNIVIYTAIGAGLGGVLGRQIAKLIAQKSSDPETTAKESAKKPFVGIPIIIGVFLLPFLYKNMALPRIIPLDLISMFGDEPELVKMLVAMKQHEPQYYKKLVTAIDKPARNGGSFEEGYKAGEQIGNEIAEDKMKYANAKVLRFGLKTAQATFAEFKTTAPRQCVNMFYERPLAIKEDTKSKELVRDEARLSTLLIKLPRTGDTSFDPVSAAVTMEELGARLLGYTTDSDDLDPKASASLDVHKRMCDIGAFTMGEYIKLDDEDLVDVMRHIFNG